MPASLAKLRRTWFALLRQAGVPAEDRHWVQEARTGKASLHDWSRRDFEEAIAAMQRELGQHADPSAHVRADEPARARSDQAGFATADQAAYIEALCDQVAWRVGRQDGPLAFLCRTVLGGEDRERARADVQRAASEGMAGAPLWRCLALQDAAVFIVTLQSAVRQYPQSRARPT